MFESKPDSRKIVLLIFLIKNDSDLLIEYGFLKNDINRLSLEIKNILIELNEEYFDYIKNEEESIIERIPNKEMEAYFSNLFEDIRHERSFILLLSLTDPVILRQSKFTDYEIDITKK